VIHLLEIRWHGRAGQGVKTAAYLLAEAAMDTGKYIQAFPEYGAERSGAPIAAFTRIDDQPIRIHYGILTPDVVVVVDESLIGAMDLTAGLKDDGILLINSNQGPEVYQTKVAGFKGKIATVDATQIALDCIGRPIPNIPIMGALIKVSGIVSLEDLEPRLRHKFSAKFNEQIVEGNVRALRRGYEEVKVL
jgi:pyruvate ferredoxin oxidoreductase gamma subunit